MTQSAKGTGTVVLFFAAEEWRGILSSHAPENCHEVAECGRAALPDQKVPYSLGTSLSIFDWWPLSDFDQIDRGWKVLPQVVPIVVSRSRPMGA